MATVDWPKCEICGGKAVAWVNDLIRHEPIFGPCTFSSMGDGHFFCKQHNRDSIEYRSSEAIAAAMRYYLGRPDSTEAEV